jgi:hypothetical protein
MSSLIDKISSFWIIVKLFYHPHDIRRIFNITHHQILTIPPIFEITSLSNVSLFIMASYEERRAAAAAKSASIIAAAHNLDRQVYIMHNCFF